jgi:hypothetical protein
MLLDVRLEGLWRDFGGIHGERVEWMHEQMEGRTLLPKTEKNKSDGILNSL